MNNLASDRSFHPAYCLHTRLPKRILRGCLLDAFQTQLLERGPIFHVKSPRGFEPPAGCFCFASCFEVASMNSWSS